MTSAKVVGLILVVIFCVVELVKPMGLKLDNLIHGKAAIILVILVTGGMVWAVRAMKDAKHKSVQKPE